MKSDKLSVTCTCGTNVPVLASQAGTSVNCHCGKRLDVPRLSQLRVASGKAAYEAGTIDTINRMIDQGELPWGTNCAISELPTKDIVYVRILCEKAWDNAPADEARPALIVVLSLVLNPLIAMFYLILRGAFRLNSKPGKLEEHEDTLGYNRIVRLPLLVAFEHQDQIRNSLAPSFVKSVLSRVPIYQKLLTEYPQAEVIFD